MESATFSPRRNVRQNVKCAVIGCESTSRGYSELRFHFFPVPGKRFVYTKNESGKVDKTDQFEAWKKAVMIKKVTKGMRVCSLHFRRDDYVLPDVPGKRRFLKTIAVPSRNLPSSGYAKDHEAPRKIAWRRCVRKTSEIDQSFEVIELSPELHKDNSPERSQDINDPLVADDECTLISSKSATTEKRGIEAQSGFLKPKLVDFVSSDAELSSLTGIESFVIFNTIVEAVIKMFSNRLEDHNTKLSIRDKVLMCYVKLKQNMTYNCLAIMSQCSSGKTCQAIFIDLIKALSACLKGAIKWPSRETISRNLPQCFEGLEDVRVILDFKKVSTQQSKNPRQLTLHSARKKSQTCKIMTGVTPAGHISYVSQVHEGRKSDKAIFGDSNIRNLLEPGDAIMVNRESTIDEECISSNWKCYRPPVLTEKKEFTTAETTLMSKIAKARAHTELSNQRIKRFKIIRDTMPNNLMSVIEDIFIVICATVNLNSPTFKDDKFMYGISSEQ